MAALKRRLQLLLEVGVEEAVHHRVHAGRRHGRQVAGGEDDVMLARRKHLVVPVEDGVEDIEREPAESESDYDYDQHGIDALSAPRFPLPGLGGLLHHVLPSTQTQEYAQVTD